MQNFLNKFLALVILSLLAASCQAYEASKHARHNDAQQRLNAGQSNTDSITKELD